MIRVFDSYSWTTFRRLSSQISDENRRRFLVPCSIVLCLKLLVALVVYALATHGGTEFSTFWMTEWGIQPKPDWPFLFHGWDSAWYIRIAKTGYSYPAYAFLPAYPFLIRVAGGLTGEYFISSFVVSFALGILAVPMFQFLAEHYMSKNEAAVATLLFALFPPVFFFTSVAYSEPLFTVAILGTWILCLRKRYFSATAFAATATVTKVYGLLISLPLAVHLFRERKMKAAFLTLIVPSITFFGWNVYLFNLTGNWDAYRFSQSHWQKGWPLGINSLLRFIVGLWVNPGQNTPPDSGTILVVVQWLLILLFFGVLVVASTDVDRDFGAYATLLFLFVVTFGTVWSFLRFLPFILPVWFIARMRSRLIIAVAILLFPMVSLAIWYQFVVLGVWLG